MASRLTLKVRMVLAALALILPPLSLIVTGVGWLLFDRGALSLHDGMTWLIVSAALGGAAVVVVLTGRLAGWIAWRWMLLLILPALVPLGAAGYTANWLKKHSSIPDVASDMVDPPAFAGVATPYPAELAAQMRDRFPEVKAVVLPDQPEQAHAKALAAARAMGWTVTAASAPEGTIDGRGVFGRFKDPRQWTVRVRPELSGGSLVDFRIRSLTGAPDFGENGELAAGYLRRLKATE